MTVWFDIISDRSVTTRLTSGPPVAFSRLRLIVAMYEAISASDVVVACGMFSASFASCNGRTDVSNGSNTSNSPKETPAPAPTLVHVYW